MKKATLTLLVAGFALLLSACNENDEKPETEYVPGEILLGINADVPVTGVFDFVNEYNLPLLELNGFYMYSTLPNDSLSYITHELQTKPYFAHFSEYQIGTYFTNAAEDRIVVFIDFIEMTKASQQDWLQTIDKLQLKDRGLLASHILVRVTPGTEKSWINTFKNDSDVSWVMLNPKFKQECVVLD